MYKIGMIGDKDSVIGFMAVGFTVSEAETPLEGAQALRRMAGEGYAIIFVTESLAVEMEDEIARFKNSPLPAIIVLPGKEGSTGYGMNNVRRSVERAVGADILFK